MPDPEANSKFFRKINRFSFRFIEGKIDFHTKHNSFYDDNELLQSLLFLSIRNRYPENGCKRYGEIRRNNAPNADTFYRRIKEKKKKEMLEEFFFIQREIIVSTSIKQRFFYSKTIHTDINDSKKGDYQCL